MELPSAGFFLVGKEKKGGNRTGVLHREGGKGLRDQGGEKASGHHWILFKWKKERVCSQLCKVGRMRWKGKGRVRKTFNPKRRRGKDFFVSQ